MLQVLSQWKATMAEGEPPTLQLSWVCPPPVAPDALPTPPEYLLVPLEDQVQDPEQPAQVPVQPGVI